MPKDSSSDSCNYAERTRKDKNLIKRYIHYDRFNFALSIFHELKNSAPVSVLGFGAGDGELLRLLAKSEAGTFSAYEPAPTFQAPLMQNLAKSPQVKVVANIDQIESKFDMIFCLEVFEHLLQESVEPTIEAIKTLLKHDGVLILSVPHEIHLPALFKGLFRMWRRFGAFDALPSNVFKATLGLQLKRPRSRLSEHLPYHFDHTGFDYRKLQVTCEAHFSMIKRIFRPIPFVGSILNSEVYFLLKK